MIVRRNENGGGWITTQVDHARASGIVAAAMAPRFFDAAWHKEMVQLSAHHDDGWEEWERDPLRQKDGAPVDFRHVKEEAHDRIWKAGVAAVSDRVGEFGAAVLARHAQVLSPPEDDLSEWASSEIVRRLKTAFPETDPAVREWMLERAYFVLRLADVATLMPCAGWDGPIETPLLDTDGTHCDTAFRRTGAWELELDPWPIEPAELRVPIPLVRVENEAWEEGLQRLLGGERDEEMLVLRPVS